jgi:hypothetical protein
VRRSAKRRHMFWHHVTGVFHARQRTPSWSQEAQTYKYKYHKFLIAVYKFQFIYFQIDIMVTLPLSDGGGCGLFTLLWKFRGRTVVAESQSLDRATPHKWGSKNPDVNVKIGRSIRFQFFRVVGRSIFSDRRFSIWGAVQRE